MLFPDGGHYVGGFNAQFMRHGEGVRFSADGSELANGQWRDGKQHGRGQRFCGDDRYEGEFVDGQMSGLGVYTWADRRVFEGEFGGDDFNGLGVVWTAEGDMAKCGRWANEELTEACPVPLTKMPIGSFLSATGEPRGRTPRAQLRGRGGSGVPAASTADTVWLRPAAAGPVWLHGSR